MPDDPIQKIRIYCNWCKQATNHAKHGEYKGIFDDEAFTEVLLYSLWICMGCEHGVMRQEYWVNGMPDDMVELQYFPRSKQKEIIPKKYSKLKKKLSAIYSEAVSCYNENAPILCAAGLRALLEGICQDKKVRGKNLKQKIDGLQSHLPNKNIIKNLHHFRFMGNEAVHELDPPKQTELALAISVIEDLLNFFYELDYKASQLRALRRANKTKAEIRKKPADSVNFLDDAVKTALGKDETETA